MTPVNNTFWTIAAGEYTCEWEARFDNFSSGSPIVFGMDSIISGTITASVLNSGSFTVGSVVSKELVLKLYLNGTVIPKTCNVAIYYRIKSVSNPALISNWYMKGLFFVDTRETDVNGITTFTCYDSLPTLDVKENVSIQTLTTTSFAQAICYLWLTGIPYYASWYSHNDVVDKSMGGHTIINYTLRENLGFTAATSCGNWILNDSNELKLVRYDDLTYTGQIDIGKNCSDLSIGRELKIKKVTVHSSAGDFTATSGTITDGIDIEVDIPFGASNDFPQTILNGLADYTYVPFTANNCIIPPNYEVFDFVTINNNVLQILQMTTSIGVYPSVTLEAPCLNGYSHELVPTNSSIYN